MDCLNKRQKNENNEKIHGKRLKDMLAKMIKNLSGPLMYQS